MVTVPGLTPKISPVAPLMVAMVGSEEVQIPPVTVDENILCDPTQTFWMPLSVPPAGIGFTISGRVTGTLTHPAALVRV